MALLWSAYHEAGTLDEWSNGGGGSINDANSVTVASQDFVHSGAWSLKETLSIGAGSCRQIRWGAPAVPYNSNTNRDQWHSAWFYVPYGYTVKNGSPTDGINIQQFSSKTLVDPIRSDPFLILELYHPGGPTDLTLRLRATTWGGNVIGPYPFSTSGDLEYNAWAGPVVTVGSWHRLEIHHVASTMGAFGDYNFDGSVAYYFDNSPTPWHSLSNIRTRYGNGDQNFAYNFYCTPIKPTGGAQGDAVSFYWDDIEVGDARITTSNPPVDTTKDRFDDFDRADSTTSPGTPLDAGSAWEVLNGTTFGIRSNKLYHSGSGSSNVLVLQHNSANVRLRAYIAGAFDSAGIIARLADYSNFIACFVTPTTMSIYTKIAGTLVERAIATGLNIVAGDAIEFEVDSANLLTGFQNEIQRAQATNSAGSTNTKHGLHISNPAPNATDWENFTIDTLPLPPTEPTRWFVSRNFGRRLRHH